MSRIYIPTQSADEWKQLLAEPERHWRQGFSAYALAHSWQDAGGFPAEVKSVLSRKFSNLELLMALVEHKVSLPGGGHPSQNDIWVFARSGDERISIAVEGKVAEPFGPTVQAWLTEASPGKSERLEFLRSLLSLSSNSGSMRYQLLHRTASAIIEAQRFGAAHAVMLVHSFSQSNEGFQDYEDFVKVMGGSASVNDIASVGTRGGVSLHLAWVQGNAAYFAN
jgi:hypothetical protein